MKRWLLLQLLLCLAILLPSSRPGSGLHVTGSGTFSFADGLTTVGLSDLTSFSDSEVETIFGSTTLFSFGIPDLQKLLADTQRNHTHSVHDDDHPSTQ